MFPSRRLLVAGTVVASLLVAPAAWGQPASPRGPSPRSVRVGRAPTRPADSQVLGALPGDTPLLLSVALEPRDPVALERYATAVSSPGSSVYRHYLTVAQFRQRFGPTNSEISAVQLSLRAHGVHPGQVSANGLSIPISARASQIARALSISFDQVKLRSGRHAFATTVAPAFDSSIASRIQGVVGLANLSVPHPLGVAPAQTAARAANATAHVVTGGPQPCAAATSDASTTNAYTADQLASAYSFSSLYGVGDKGAGQTVALYELEPNSTSDIAAYQGCYGTSTPVSYVQVDGGAGSGSGSGEAALDIEDVLGLAPSAAIRVYQGPNTNAGAYDTYDRIVTDDVAKVISSSWGLCESQEGSSAAQAENTLFQEAATQGQSIFAAAGDDGSQACTNSSGKPLSGLAVDDPASQPYVTGVGGTRLSAIGPPPTQSVWNDGSTGGAGGGGVSALWPMPPYQSSAPSSLDLISSSSSGTPCAATPGGYCREVPDVSANADEFTGYVVYYNGSWTAYGGTSAAAPLWAAFTALTNASSGCSGTPIGFANPVLYSVAASGYSSDFSDVTSANNNLSGSGLYPAGTAYDMASGLGTPIGSALPAALCAAATAKSAHTVTVTNPGGKTNTAGEPVNLQINATDSDGPQTLAYSATGLPSGLLIDSATGLISGTPTAAGSSSVNVSAMDSTNASGSATFTWSIAKRATATALACLPASVNTGSPASCRATVTDTDGGTASTPRGTVNFGAAHAGGSFPGASTCALSSTSTTGVATCQTTYLSSAAGPQTITAAYPGDNNHSTSTSSGFGLIATAPSSGSGGGAPSSPVPKGQPVPGPTHPGCPAATGRLSSSTLGLARLGMTRRAVRAEFSRTTIRSAAYQDVICLAPAGLRVGYPSPRLLSALGSGRARQLRGRAIWITTANRHYAVDHVTVGTRMALATRTLPGGSTVKVAKSTWYVVRKRRSTLLLEIHRGLVQELGIANNTTTGTAHMRRRLASALA